MRVRNHQKQNQNHLNSGPYTYSRGTLSIFLINEKKNNTDSAGDNQSDLTVPGSSRKETRESASSDHNVNNEADRGNAKVLYPEI